MSYQNKELESTKMIKAVLGTPFQKAKGGTFLLYILTYVYVIQI